MLKVTLVATVLALFAEPSLAETVNVKLICGPNMTDPVRLRAFQSLLLFDISGARLEATHTFRSNGGSTERFEGLISSEGRVQISGQGSSADGGAWMYEFIGQRANRKETVLKGKRVNTLGITGQRDCTLRFMRNMPVI